MTDSSRPAPMRPPLPKQILIVLIVGVMTFAVSLVPAWVAGRERSLSGYDPALRVVTSLVMASAMLALERRRGSTSLWHVLTDGLLVAAIVIVAGNVGASDAFIAQLTVRTVATLLGLPLLFLLTHALVMRASDH